MKPLRVLPYLLLGTVIVGLLWPSVVSAQKTLRDQVREKGYAKSAWWDDLPHTVPHTMEQLVKRSDLIFRGEVVNQTGRMSPDESRTLTDYTIEVGDVIKDPSQQLRRGERILVTRNGGSATLEGRPVHVENTTFLPVPWRTEAIFFVIRAHETNTWFEYMFTYGEFGVWTFRGGRFACETKRKREVGFTAGQCNKSEADVESALRRLTTEQEVAQE